MFHYMQILDLIFIFNFYQMYQIRLGLEYGLDVSIYATSEFNSDQMQQIRLGCLHGIDVSIYSNPSIDNEEMRTIRLELESNK